MSEVLKLANLDISLLMTRIINLSCIGETLTSLASTLRSIPCGSSQRWQHVIRPWTVGWCNVITLSFNMSWWHCVQTLTRMGRWYGHLALQVRHWNSELEHELEHPVSVPASDCWLQPPGDVTRSHTLKSIHILKSESGSSECRESTAIPAVSNSTQPAPTLCCPRIDFRSALVNIFS